MLKRCIAIVLLLSCGAPARAEVVRDLYSAQVPVEDQGEAARARAAARALTEVLIKVSGSVEVVDNPVLAAAVGEARRHVQQYGYSREPGAQQPLRARFEFDPGFVTSLVVEAGVPLWTANRPPVLVWLVIEDATGRYLANEATAGEVTRLLQRAFSRRGVPVELPLLDLADTAALSPQEAWRLDGNAIETASARYGAAHVLAGRVALLADERVAGEWSFRAPDVRLGRSVEVDALEDFFGAGAAIAAQEMAARYAVAPSEAAVGGLAMTIKGVVSYQDYATIVNWLERLELVDRATVTRIRGDVLELRLSARTDPARLATLIELNDRFAPDYQPGESPQLSYRWQN